MQKNTTIDKKIPVTVRVTGCLQGIKVLNSGDVKKISAIDPHVIRAFP